MLRKAERYLLSVSEVVEWPLLVDDTHSGFLCSDTNALDIVRGLAQSLQLVVYDMRGLDRCLSVEFCGVRDLE